MLGVVITHYPVKNKQINNMCLTTLFVIYTVSTMDIKLDIYIKIRLHHHITANERKHMFLYSHRYYSIHFFKYFFMCDTSDSLFLLQSKRDK